MTSWYEYSYSATIRFRCFINRQRHGVQGSSLVMGQRGARARLSGYQSFRHFAWLGYEGLQGESRKPKTQKTLYSWLHGGYMSTGFSGGRKTRIGNLRTFQCILWCPGTESNGAAQVDDTVGATTKKAPTLLSGLSNLWCPGTESNGAAQVDDTVGVATKKAPT